MVTRDVADAHLVLVLIKPRFAEQLGSSWVQPRKIKRRKKKKKEKEKMVMGKNAIKIKSSK